MNNEINRKFICPLTKKIFKDPVRASDGNVYENQAIQKWLSAEDTSPVTRELMDENITTAEDILEQINSFLSEHPDHVPQQYIPSLKLEDNKKLINELISVKSYKTLLNYTHFDLAYLFNVITNIESFMTNEELVLIHIINNALDLEQIIVHGWKLIHIICLYSTRLLSFLIKKNVTIDSIEENGLTPLHIVTKQNNFEAIKILMQYGANPLIMSSDGWNVLHYACTNNNMEIIRYFVDVYESNGYKEYLETATKDNWYPIHLVCHHGTFEAIEYMINKGVDLNVTTSDNWTPLHVVCYLSSYDTIKYFLDLNLDRSKKIRKLYGKPVKCNYLDLIMMNEKLSKAEKKELCVYKRDTFKKRKH